MEQVQIRELEEILKKIYTAYSHNSPDNIQSKEAPYYGKWVNKSAGGDTIESLPGDILRKN
jgi:hypothetical protein